MAGDCEIYGLTDVVFQARDIIKSSGYSTLWGTDKSQMQTAATQMRLMKPEHIKFPLDSLELIRKRLGRDVQPVEKKADAKREVLPQGYNTILAGKTRTKDKSVRKVPTFVSSCAGGVNSEIIQTIMTSMLDTVKRNVSNIRCYRGAPGSHSVYSWQRISGIYIPRHICDSVHKLDEGRNDAFSVYKIHLSVSQ